MRISPSKDGGRVVEGDTPYGRFRFWIAPDATMIDYLFEMRNPQVPGSDRPTLPIPDDFDVETERPRTLSPGSLLTNAIKLITGTDPGPQCSCKHRASRMNEWGWWGCWRKRATIAEWLVEEARKRNHEIDEHKAASLFKAAWKEIRQRRKDETT